MVGVGGGKTGSRGTKEFKVLELTICLHTPAPSPSHARPPHPPHPLMPHTLTPHSDVPPNPYPVRLMGGNDTAGRVEIFYNGQWGSICDDHWTSNEASVICRELGFPGQLSAVTQTQGL